MQRQPSFRSRQWRQQTLVPVVGRREFLAAAAGTAVGFGGCAARQAEAPTQRAKPFQGEDLRAIVVGDRPLADAIRRISGEWHAQTGSQLEVVELGERDPLVPENLVGDVVIFPSAMLGTLADNKLISPAPPSIAEGEQLGWPDIFDPLRLREARWNEVLYGVPLGSAQLVLYLRADLLKALGAEPPKTWGEYETLAERLAERDALGEAAPPADRPWAGTVEPLGPGYAGLTLIARAACYAQHRDHYSALFNIDSMEPLIDQPPVVLALEEMVAAARHSPAEVVRFGPAEVRHAFWKGQCGMAVGWPNASPGQNELRVRDSRAEVLFAPLPGSRNVFDPGKKSWDERSEAESGRVALLGAFGRLGAVTRESKRQQPAFQLLALLSTEPWCNQVSPYSGQTAMFRRSQLSNPEHWVETEVSPGAARQYADVLRGIYGETRWLDGLRIPGRDEYLESLDQAVHRALSHQTPPREALVAAAARWREITDGHQVTSQRRAYQRSLGIGV